MTFDPFHVRVPGGMKKTKVVGAEKSTEEYVQHQIERTRIAKPTSTQQGSDSAMATFSDCNGSAALTPAGSGSCRCISLVARADDRMSFRSGIPESHRSDLEQADKLDLHRTSMEKRLR